MITMLALASPAAAAPFQGTIEYRVRLTGDRAAPLQAMSPDTVILELGKKAYALEVRGGAAPPGRFLVSLDTGDTVFLSDISQTVAPVPDPLRPTTSIEALDATETILGYACTKHLVVRDTPGGAERGWVWTTSAIDAPPEIPMFAGLPTPFVGVTPGLPLRLVLDDGRAVLTIEAVSIDDKPPKRSRLVPPPGWEAGTFPTAGR